MKKNDELKDLLDRLKEEVTARSAVPGPERPEDFYESFEEAPRGGGMDEAVPPAPRPEKVQAAVRPEFQRPERTQAASAGGNVIWSENKETMLFGILASLLFTLGGILAGLDHVILIGAVAFMLFSFITVLTLLGYYLDFRSKNQPEGLLGEKVEHLSRRLEALALKSVPGQSQNMPAPQAGDKELEQKVDELRTLVRSLAKAVEGGNPMDR